MRRLLVVAGLSAAVMVPAAPASAHVVLERTEVAPGTVVELAFRAPVEQPGTTNRRIYALFPGPLAVRSCEVPSAAWRCTTDTTTRPGSTFVTWETPVAGSPQDLRFLFTLEVPAGAPAAEHKVPVVQTYSDGTVARWIDDGEPSPAPRLTVVGKGQTPRTAAPTAATHVGAAAEPSAQPGATRAAGRSTAPSAAAVSGSPAASEATVASSSATAAATAAPDAPVADVAVETSSGSSTPALVGGLLLLIALFAAAVGLRRKRTA